MRSCVLLVRVVAGCGCGTSGGGLQALEGTELYLLQVQPHLEGKSMMFSADVIL